MTPKWQGRFLDRCKQLASWSKDPSTKVGAVIVDPSTNTCVGEGYNGFPRGVLDNEYRYANRELKYSLVVHAEANAIIEAGHRAKGATLFVWPLFTCNECAKLVIQAGIKKVVSVHPENTRWLDSNNTALMMFQEAGVEVEWLD